MRTLPIAVSLLVLFHVPAADAQQPTRTPAQTSGAAPATRGAATTPADQASTPILERELRLSRTQLDAVTKALAASNPQPAKKGGLNVGNLLKSAVGNDDAKAAAARAAEELAETEAATVANREGRTVILVVGDDADRVKVRDSLSGVQQKVLLMWANPDFNDPVADNSGLKGGLLGQITGAVANVWVFHPVKPAVADPEPSQKLSSRIVSPGVWSGLAVAGGDASQVTSLASGLRSQPSTDASAQPAPAGTSGTAAAPAAARFAEGDVLTPKIASVRILAQPADDAKVVATLAKTDELVVVGAERNGFVNVQGSAAAGWVKASLVDKR